MSKVIVTKDGPYSVEGRISLNKEVIVADKMGESIGWKETAKFPAKETYLLCRCGNSRAQPFCDSSHLKPGFDGTETASKKSFLSQSLLVEGKKLSMRDAKEFCASARFCDRLSGAWTLVKQSSNPENRKNAIEEVKNCPSGRLVVYDNLGKEIEPSLPKSITIVEDVPAGVSGPIWVKGKIPIISADGHEYERRNRVTLCRCGCSENKPFCDGTHIPVEFNDDFFPKKKPQP